MGDYPITALRYLDRIPVVRSEIVVDPFGAMWEGQRCYGLLKDMTVGGVPLLNKKYSPDEYEQFRIVN